jgi:hypothetical protein
LKWRRIFLRLFVKRKHFQIQKKCVDLRYDNIFVPPLPLFGTASNEIRGRVCVRALFEVVWWHTKSFLPGSKSFVWVTCTFISPCCFSHRGKYKGRSFYKGRYS